MVSFPWVSAPALRDLTDWLGVRIDSVPISFHSDSLLVASYVATSVFGIP
ncbi:hypothetical protein CCACVL1_22141 [Corchorus capsularis]|uniref:Uncharacterized protein n=1 Tax=Corchorus capsularis TaxID=210143 RepID=A0A1R3H0Z3_COCAP|nr:hypothetical protein CCACVL1_22141 [Corchorus capsularis]